ncbi:MAG: sensor histidine kinase [Lachnospiraceae bacterium]|nr:sensor histidine kinase [Lachnospiraceae bacterium]
MKSIENKSALIIDIFFCAIFMPVLIFLGPAHSWMQQWTLFFILSCLLFYGSYFVVKWINMPMLLISRNYKRIGLVLGALIACNYLLTLYPLPEMDFITPAMSEYQTRIRNYSITISLWMMFSLVMGYALTTSFVIELYDQLLQKKKIEAQRDKAKLAMFKAQISPHFLFNTLNTLYSLVIGTSQKAEDAFIKFTELLKYTYITIENEYVPLKDEIAYIQNYIDLQVIRLNQHTVVKWSYEVDDENVMIPPMLMLTFVENAFKYGASTSRDCVISISLALDSGMLEFRTSNYIMKHVSEFHSDMSVGIENCRARLNGIFPKKHTLTTSESDGMFNVNLSINLR